MHRRKIECFGTKLSGRDLIESDSRDEACRDVWEAIAMERAELRNKLSVSVPSVRERVTEEEHVMRGTSRVSSGVEAPAAPPDGKNTTTRPRDMTQPRIPEVSDFPGDLVVSIIPPQDEKKPVSNILLLLHGLGDTNAPFTNLAKNFNFPETACLAIRGPSRLPFDENGFHWGDDLIFDTSQGGLDMEAQFTQTHELLEKILDILVGKCAWKRRAIFFFGLGQGGMVALDIASRLPAGGPDGEYGGVVSLGGPLPHDAPSPGRKAKTPVMLMGAERVSAITEDVEARVKNVFEFAEIVRWSGRKEDGMMRNQEEAMPMMKFYARRLRSRAGIPDGAVELS